MPYRIDVFTADGQVRLGYLRRVGRELSLTLPIKKKVVENGKPPLLIDHPDELGPLFKKFMSSRRNYAFTPVREMTAVAVEMSIACDLI